MSDAYLKSLSDNLFCLAIRLENYDDVDTFLDWHDLKEPQVGAARAISNLKIIEDFIAKAQELADAIPTSDLIREVKTELMMASNTFIGAVSSAEWEFQHGQEQVAIKNIRDVTRKAWKLCGKKLRRLIVGVKVLSREAPSSADEPTAAKKPVTSAPMSARERRVQWEIKAMMLVQDHPEWSDAKIARHVGKNPATLSRSKQYKKGAALARSGGIDLPKGYKTVDEVSKTTDVAAVAPPTRQAVDHPDRGERIPGSRYYREYCAYCDEQMKVPKNQVGQRPTCERCEE
ncbi:MAG: hypothetical protein IT444_12390 [Phycisphaeraceae bacterium]|nr:hypothetical protein [Phycisphaeraceae bacterium]